MSNQTSVECLWETRTILGEAPYWCTHDKVLYWVDIDGKMIFSIDPVSGMRQEFRQDYEFGCIVKRSDGGFIAGTNEGLVHLDQALSSPDIFAVLETQYPDNRFNDGKCDRRGRFWVGSTDRNEKETTGALYRVNGSGDISQMCSEVFISNGLGWSPDNKSMYFTDSGHGTIYVFDYDIDTGEIENKSVFATVDRVNGMPDGLTVDAEGGIWSAHWGGGGRITRYDPDGQIERVIEMPVPLVTSLAFGGENLDQIFITTASLGLSETDLKEAPLSGSLFTFNVGIKGLAEIPYQ